MRSVTAMADEQHPSIPEHALQNQVCLGYLSCDSFSTTLRAEGLTSGSSCKHCSTTSAVAWGHSSGTLLVGSNIVSGICIVTHAQGSGTNTSMHSRKHKQAMQARSRQAGWRAIHGAPKLPFASERTPERSELPATRGFTGTDLPQHYAIAVDVHLLCARRLA